MSEFIHEIDPDAKKVVWPFIDTFGEKLTKKQAVREKIEILTDMYLDPEGRRRIPGADMIEVQIRCGLMKAEYKCSEDLDKVCHKVIMEEVGIADWAAEISKGTNWELEYAKVLAKKEEAKLRKENKKGGLKS